MHKRLFVKLIAVVMALVLSMSVVTAYADQELSGPCTVEVITKDDEGKGLDGFKVALYQVAAVKDSGEYYITDEFKGSGFTIAQFTQAEVTDDMCYKLRKYALDKQLTPVGVNTTGADGMAKFENLEKGIYLFINTERTGTATTYYEFIPGVVYAPVVDDSGKVNYTSQAFPKIEKFTGEEPTPTPPPEDVPPQTGDSSRIELWNTLMYVSMGGVFLFGIFAVICGRKEDAEEDLA